MDASIVEKILARVDQPDLIDVLADELSSSELNSVLLDLFSRKAAQLSAPDLLKSYRGNRFVQPADVDVLALRRLETTAYETFSQFGFTPIELSPVSALGSCSVVATADQKKVLSAGRQTEVMADATNALALHIADLKHRGGWQPDQPTDRLHFGTIHRHLRTPPVPKIPGFRPHFKVACLVTSGRDTGSFQFEKEALTEHIVVMTAFFREQLRIDRLRFRLTPRKGYPDPIAFVEQLRAYVAEQRPDVVVEAHTDAIGENNYYKGLQYKIDIEINGQVIEIGDGGYVDWTQQLLQNKKERLLTTGFGIELLYRLIGF
ncbi:hypothetical protein DYU11_01540 [Fibrisoma montanum]|uniref:Uncharacterized protein n=1 Tax=Fibrisoma montanum TaxID=2305895 RepID=A0A418MHX8_9BACT|nr:hypothetical protein [Fibrisoma montanum]RIV27026.1 hypothetical protein DYU11_01540 [Fibrisoma montanum]